MKRKWICIQLVLLSFLIVSCVEEGPRVLLDPDYEIDDFVPTQELDYTPEPTRPKPTPTQPPFMISKDIFTFPTDAMSFNPPVFWNLDKQSSNYVKYIADDRRAFFEAGYESVGYELDREAFDSYKDNAMQSLYGLSEDFETEEEVFEGTHWTITSTFVNNGITWKTRDIFTQRKHAIYFISFHALADEWDYYDEGFNAVYESIETKSGFVTLDYLNEFTSTYVDPGEVFRVRKPIGWSASGVETLDDRTVRESLLSPDGIASMQTVIYSPEDELTPDNIGQTAFGLLREIIAEDMKFDPGSYVLPDGRIRLDWVSASLKSSGFSFFWLSGYDLYLLTFMQGPVQDGVYLQAIYQIGDSFSFQTTGSGS